MKIKNRIFDNRINSLNLLLETTLNEYFDLSEDILKNNEFQRRRVRSSQTVYSLLKSDLKRGCVTPPIVLALSVNVNFKQDDEDEALLKQIDDNKNKLVILDGLQRTYTIRDLIQELRQIDDPDLPRVLNNPLRIEIYLGINKLGVLYRMLTLNTGQTPMSVRHQIEILYSDYLQTGLEGVKLLREINDNVPGNIGEYKFNDIIEGFNSYLDRDYLPIDRLDILDNIKSLEKLSSENQQTDLFKDFVLTYNKFAVKIATMAGDWAFSDENIDSKLSGTPFARSVEKIFNKSQVMTGFGSAVGKLLDFKAIKQVDEVNNLIDQLNDDDINETLNLLIKRLDDVRLLAKKIGNDQRLFFHYFFRELFDNKADGYIDIKRAINEAYGQYERRTQL